MADRLIHLNECAGLMGVSLSKAYRLAKAQKAPFENIQKYGSTYRCPTWPFASAWVFNPSLNWRHAQGMVTSNVHKRQNAREGCGDLGG